MRHDVSLMNDPRMEEFRHLTYPAIEVFELFRPQEAVSADVLNMVNKCLEDFSSSLRVSFEKSIKDSVRKIQQNL